MDERDRRIAFVGEQFELEDAFRLSGRFDVHWEALDGQGHGDGPEGVSVDEAIAWGRQHARYVNVLVGDSDTQSWSTCSDGDDHASRNGEKQ
jgi:hypothetical protein